jgi:uncharacterized protein
MIFVDTNIFIYASGKDHPNKKPSLQLLERVAQNSLEVSISSEIIQEILHRYRAINRSEEGFKIYELTRTLIETVFPMTVETMDLAKKVLETYDQLAARDAVHIATCLNYQISNICTFDKDFFNVSEISAHPPQYYLDIS